MTLSTDGGGAATAAASSPSNVAGGEHVFAACVIPCSVATARRGARSEDGDDAQCAAAAADTSANGLPLAGATVRALACGRRLVAVRHCNLASYVDVHTAANDRIVLISEHSDTSVADLLRTSGPPALDDLHKFAIVRQAARALRHLHTEPKVACGRLALDQLLVQSIRPLHVKLTGYGLPLVSGHGANIDFTIASAHTMPPEVFCAGDARRGNAACSHKGDVWSLGMCIFYLLTGCVDGWKTRQLLSILAAVIHSGCESAFDQLFTACKLLSGSQNQCVLSTDRMPPILLSLARRCLCLDPVKRPSAREIVQMMDESDVPTDDAYDISETGSNFNNVFEGDLRNSSTIDVATFKERICGHFHRLSVKKPFAPVMLRPIDEVYALWKLTGSATEVILKRKGIIADPAPITVIPQTLCADDAAAADCAGSGSGDRWHRHARLRPVPLSARRLFQRLDHLEGGRFICSLHQRYGLDALPSVDGAAAAGDTDGATKEHPGDDLPPVVKETNVEYQVERLAVFHRLLSAYPATEQWLKMEARVDIPPLYRRYVWPALLGIGAGDLREYELVDTEAAGVSDKQIEVDVPRCHQYNQLLTSPLAHDKFKRLLKAWLHTQPHLVYWQGLDSLCAPFLYMHFDNEPLAFACFKAFTRRYMSGLFAQHNAPFIQECLAVFAHLIAFHDPQLHVHLEEIGFSTDLYAIPWLLTMFAHALSIGRLLPVWDAIVTRDDRSFGLCFGVALLQAHRRRLLASGFNESILLFSDLPSIDVYTCLQEASRIYERTPPSVAQLVYSPQNEISDDKLCATEEKSKLQPMSALDLRRMPCARIAADDLASCGTNGAGGHKARCTWAPAMVVDVRPFEERQRSAPEGSVHVPIAAAAASHGEHKQAADGGADSGGRQLALPTCPGSEVLRRHKDAAVVALLSSGAVNGDTLHKFVRGLIADHYGRVCIVDNGIAAMKAANLL